MVTRLPTQLDALVPPPSLQLPVSPQSALLSPWRGLFLVSGTRASDISSNVEIRVTGVETDGDISYVWPSHIVFSITVPRALPVLSQLQSYIRTRSPPIPVATFLPERLRDPDHNAINQTHFRSLSRMLWDSQLVAIVPISPSSSRDPGKHGMLIYPAGNSSSLLVGAIFLAPEDVFPDFVYSTQETSPGDIGTFPVPSSSQNPIRGFGTPPGGDTTSIPISPTVLYSQSRQNQQRRGNPQSFSPFRSQSTRMSSSYRYNPVSSGGPSFSSSQRPRSADLSLQRGADPFIYQTDNFSSPNFLSANPVPEFRPAPSLAHPDFSAQSDLPLEDFSMSYSGNPYPHYHDGADGNSHSETREERNHRSRSNSTPIQQSETMTSHPSIFNPFDLTTRTHSH